MCDRGELYKAFSQKICLVKSSFPLLLLVSGGNDSIALLHLCVIFFTKEFLSKKAHKKNGSLATFLGVLHVNYGLRPQENEKEQALIKQYCDDWGIPVYLESASLLSSKISGNTQDLARKKRFAIAWEKCKSFGYKAIVTAHHRDDAVETFLQKILQGQSVTSLGAFEFKSNFWVKENRENKKKIILLRPLIDFDKKTLLEYTEENDLKYQFDSTNALDCYQRNYLRHKILPLLRERFPDADQNLLRSKSHIKDFWLFGNRCALHADFFVFTGPHIVFSEKFFTIFSEKEKMVVVHQYFLRCCPEKRFSHRELAMFFKKISCQKEKKSGSKGFVILLKTIQNTYFFLQNAIFCDSNHKKRRNENDFFCNFSLPNENPADDQHFFSIKLEYGFFLQFGGEPSGKNKWLLGSLVVDAPISLRMTKKKRKEEDRIVIDQKSLSLEKYLKNCGVAGFFRERGWRLFIKKGDNLWALSSFFCLDQFLLGVAQAKMKNNFKQFVVADSLKEEKYGENKFSLRLWIAKNETDKDV